jgi:hypothetical protein
MRLALKPHVQVAAAEDNATNTKHSLVECFFFAYTLGYENFIPPVFLLKLCQCL